MKRRAFLSTLALPLAAPALIGLTRKSPRPLAGGFVDDGGTRGHQLRNHLAAASTAEPRHVPIVIVGGGVAGLCAGWELARHGHNDFIILELEMLAGGN